MPSVPSYELIKDLMTRMYNKVPSEPEYRRIESMINRLGIKDNDEFILLIIILEMHRVSLQLAPIKMSESVVASVREITRQNREAMSREICGHINGIKRAVDDSLEGMRQRFAKNQKSLASILKELNAKLDEIAQGTQKTAGELSFRTIAMLACGGVACFCLGFIICMLVK